MLYKVRELIDKGDVRINKTQCGDQLEELKNFKEMPEGLDAVISSGESVFDIDRIKNTGKTILDVWGNKTLKHPDFERLNK